MAENPQVKVHEMAIIPQPQERQEPAREKSSSIPCVPMELLGAPPAGGKAE